MTTNGAWGGGRARVSTYARRRLERLALAALDRLDGRSGIDDDQRALLLDDLGEDLDDLSRQAEDGGVGEERAEEMATIRATILWLEGRGASPGPTAVEHFERGLGTIHRRPNALEASRRSAYLAAIGGLGGDAEAASRIRRRSPGLDDPAGYGKVLAFQGRRLRGLLRERGMSIGELAERSEIDDVVLLISFLLGLEEIRFEEAMRLAGALDVSPARFSEGVRWVPGAGVYEIDPEAAVPAEDDMLDEDEDAGPPRPEEGRSGDAGEGGGAR
ncbi:MAG: hypothetical protein JSU06_16605 [Actinobacteria bacterium]|nr:hypothetical protein [Actinomycetota bacterium]